MSEHGATGPSMSEHGAAGPSMSDPIQPTVLDARGRPIDTATRAKRPRRGWDILLSILLLMLSVATAILGFVLAVFNLAFVVDCTGLCSPGNVVGSQFGSGVAVAIILVSGTIFTMYSIIRWRRGWWAALLTFVLVVGAWVVGWILLGAAAG